MAIDPTTVFNAVAAPSGTAFLDQYHDVLGALIDTSVLRLASVAGSDAITATAEPFEVASTGLVSGMKFTLEPVANNTGAATLNINGRGAQSIVSGDGSTLAPDELVSGTRYLLEFDGTNFVLLSATGGGAAAAASRTTYDTTTVWSNGFPAETLIQVELWGAGGGGSSLAGGDGGGGGGYATKVFRAGDLPSSVTITVPSGGAINTVGGNCTFGSLLTAYGGGGASSSGATDGGGGGGELEAGSVSFGGSIGGGDVGINAQTIYGGGGGGEPGDGGMAVYGGGGGGSGGSVGGSSVYGGAGGDDGSAGQRPGGGGGNNASGGAGRCIITIFGG